VREGARPAGAADIPRLAELCRSGLAELTAGRGGALLAERQRRAEPLEEALAADLAHPRRHGWVGTLDDEVVGYAAGRTETLPGGSELGVVEALFVEPDARGVGVGEVLMDAMLAWFTDRGCIGVDCQALPGDRLTKNFLESGGFKARLIVMHRSLGP
jgi:GNAT superfamily N-acetyltransferase